MRIIGNLWWVWLLCFVIFGAYTLSNQLKRMKGMTRGMRSGSVDDAFESATHGMSGLVVGGALAWLSGMLFIVSIIVQIFMK